MYDLKAITSLATRDPKLPCGLGVIISPSFLPSYAIITLSSLT